MNMLHFLLYIWTFIIIEYLWPQFKYVSCDLFKKQVDLYEAAYTVEEDIYFPKIPKDSVYDIHQIKSHSKQNLSCANCGGTRLSLLRVITKTETFNEKTNTKIYHLVCFDLKNDKYIKHLNAYPEDCIAPIWKMSKNELLSVYSLNRLAYDKEKYTRLIIEIVGRFMVLFDGLEDSIEVRKNNTFFALYSLNSSRSPNGTKIKKTIKNSFFLDALIKNYAESCARMYKMKYLFEYLSKESLKHLKILLLNRVKKELSSVKKKTIKTILKVIQKY